MYFLLAFSLLCCWMIYREFVAPTKFDTFSLGFVTVLAIFAVLFAWKPVTHFHFEHVLTRHAVELSGNPKADVTCNTVMQSVWERFGIAGTGHPDTGEIVMNYPQCNLLRDYIAEPRDSTPRERWSLSVFVHEAMHVRGEWNEQLTECQSIQHQYRGGVIVGLPDSVARDDAVDFWLSVYRKHPYFTKDCYPGSAMDEELPDSTWNFLPDSVSDTD